MYEEIINSLDSEIRNLETAKKLLGGSTAPKKPSGRVVSAEGRANMIAAQKRRWAKAKKSA